MFQESFNGKTSGFQEKFQECFKKVSRIFQESVNCISTKMKFSFGFNLFETSSKGISEKY